MAQEAAKRMCEAGGGAIISIASTAGLRVGGNGVGPTDSVIESWNLRKKGSTR